MFVKKSEGARGSGGVIFALDYPRLDEARRSALVVADAIGMVKVGLELFASAGPEAVAVGRDVGLPVFLDLKLCDIPATVERTIAALSSLGARMITVHASGGPEMLRRAVSCAKKNGTTEVAAVTVLTSLEAADLARVGVERDPLSQALLLAKMAYGEGVTHFVCSPREASTLRSELGEAVTLITPGVRAADHFANATGRTPMEDGRREDDQKRVTTAREAIEAGADWVVVGRPIREAEDPLSAARSFSSQVESARRGSRP